MHPLHAPYVPLRAPYVPLMCPLRAPYTPLMCPLHPTCIKYIKNDTLIIILSIYIDIYSNKQSDWLIITSNHSWPLRAPYMPPMHPLCAPWRLLIG